MEQELTFYPIPGYNGRYLASECGKIMSARRGEMSQTLCEAGYLCLKLSSGGVRKHCFVHRLVCETFHPNPKGLKVVHHKDRNRLNNHKDNVEWSTQSDNVQDTWDSGARKRKSIAKTIMKKRHG